LRDIDKDLFPCEVVFLKGMSDSWELINLEVFLPVWLFLRKRQLHGNFSDIGSALQIICVAAPVNFRCWLLQNALRLHKPLAGRQSLV
jgi:hypothetical protein